MYIYIFKVSIITSCNIFFITRHNTSLHTYIQLSMETLADFAFYLD